jgi:hypothetical protein
MSEVGPEENRSESKALAFRSRASRATSSRSRYDLLCPHRSGPVQTPASRWRGSRIFSSKRLASSLIRWRRDPNSNKCKYSSSYKSYENCHLDKIYNHSVRRGFWSWTLNRFYKANSVDPALLCKMFLRNGQGSLTSLN